MHTYEKEHYLSLSIPHNVSCTGFCSIPHPFIFGVKTLMSIPAFQLMAVDPLQPTPVGVQNYIPGWPPKKDDNMANWRATSTAATETGHPSRPSRPSRTRVWQGGGGACQHTHPTPHRGEADGHGRPAPTNPRQHNVRHSRRGGGGHGPYGPHGPDSPPGGRWPLEAAGHWRPLAIGGRTPQLLAQVPILPGPVCTPTQRSQGDVEAQWSMGTTVLEEPGMRHDSGTPRPP